MNSGLARGLTPSGGLTPLHPSRWLLLAAATILLALPLLVSLPSHPIVMARLHDFGHAPLFGAFALVVLGLLPEQHTWRRYLAALLIAVACGAVVEIVQGFIGRDAEWTDLATDAAGAGSALLFLAAWRLGAPAGRRLQARLLAGSVASILLLLAAAPLLHAGAACLLRERRFPVLLHAQTALDAYYLSGGDNRIERRGLPDPWRLPSDTLAYWIELQPIAWSGVALQEPAPDWRGHKTLVLVLVNPSVEALGMTLRVHDALHDQSHADRFNRSFELPAESRTVLRVPLAEIAGAPAARTMDMAAVTGVILFARETSTRARDFYLVGIWLE